MRRRNLLSYAAVGGFGSLGGVGPLAVLALGAAAPADNVIAVVARKFVFLPNQITVRQGEPVVLEFTAPEVVMGFYAPELKLRAVIVPGEVARVRFVPERVGRFDFLCDIFCGDGHEGMSGAITVVV